MIAFQVNDMTCGHCVATITKAVQGVDAGATVRTDLDTHRVMIESAAPAEALGAAIHEAGYTPEALGNSEYPAGATAVPRSVG